MDRNRSWRDSLSPELELVLCCARMPLDQANAGRIRKILSESKIDFSRLAEIAFAHHLEPLLYENLKLASGEQIPERWMAKMRESARKTGAMAVLFSSELFRVSEIFAAAKVPLVPYKGPVLGWLGYQSLTRRRFLDLDFFVPQNQMTRAATLLKSAGFEGKNQSAKELEGRSGYVPGQYAFFRKTTQTQVELHTERTLRYFPVPLNFEKMSRRLIDIELCGQHVKTFSIEDTLVMLSVHGTKHFWERLSWIVDIAQLISVSNVDWKLLMEIAAEMKSTRVLLLGLYLAHDVFAAPLPDSVLNAARGDREVLWLATSVCEQFAGISDPSAGVWRRTKFRMRSREGFLQGLRHMIRLTMSPTENDRESVHLPGILTPLYIFVRPWRLLRGYGLGTKRTQSPEVAVETLSPQSSVGKSPHK